MKLPMFFLCGIVAMLASCDVKKTEEVEQSVDQTSQSAESATGQAETAPAPELAFESYEVDWTLPYRPPRYAKSFYNSAAPEIVVEEWLTEEPVTDGKFVIVDFWATWCGACRATIPHMNKLSKQFADEAICIGLSKQPAARVKKMTTPVIEYYSAINTKATTRQAIELRGIPFVIVIDPNGKVCWEGFPTGLSESKLRELIDFYSAAKG